MWTLCRLVVLLFLVRSASGQEVDAGISISYLPIITFQADGVSTTESVRNRLFPGVSVHAAFSRRIVFGLRFSRLVGTISNYESDDGAFTQRHGIRSWSVESSGQYMVLSQSGLSLLIGATGGLVHVVDGYDLLLEVRNTSGSTTDDVAYRYPRAGFTVGPHVELHVDLGARTVLRWQTGLRYTRVRFPQRTGSIIIDNDNGLVVDRPQIGRTILMNGVNTTLGLSFRVQ